MNFFLDMRGQGHHNPARLPCPPLESFLNLAALEFKQAFIVGGNPAFLIAVNEGGVLRAFQRALATSEQPHIKVLAVRYAHRAVRFDEGAREELAVSGINQLL